jgi:hypothetical protein
MAVRRWVLGWLCCFIWQACLIERLAQTGLAGLGEVRSIMPPHTSENYLQHEMGFVIAA